MTFRNDVRQGIAILADDLTSAGDGAAPFRQAGHDARILLTTTAGVPRHAVGVSAVDLGSRVLDEEAAASRTWRAARLFAGSELLFKTVDSTLRGHVAAEVRAAWAGSQKRAVVIAPAFPAEGRVTVKGSSTCGAYRSTRATMPATRYTPCGARTSPCCSRKPFSVSRTGQPSCPN